MEPKAYSVNQAGEALGVSRATVYMLMRQGKLFYAQVGARKRIPVEAVDAMLRGETYNPCSGPREAHPDSTSWPMTDSLLTDSVE
jgi:excisionase family DNA binding protein